MPTNYGGPSLTPEEIEPRKAAMTRRAGRKPFESFKLTNNNVVLYPHMSCGKKGAANKFRGKKAADITMKQEMRTKYLKEVRAQLLSAALNGYERLAVLHKMFHPADNQKFRFAWDAICKTGLSSKDFIAPDSFTFKNGRMFQIGRTYGAMSFLQILAPVNFI